MPTQPEAPAAPESPSDALVRPRAGIDQIDRQLLELLGERFAHVEAIARDKLSRGAALRDAEREAQLFRDWSESARRSGVPQALALDLLERVIATSRRVQEQRHASATTRVAIQGEAGSYSDLAARKLLELRGVADARQVPCETFYEAFEALQSGAVDYALLPIDNSIAGAIGDVSAGLLRRQLHIVDEEVVDVRHVLAARAGSALADLRRVRSHPVALRQCQSLINGMRLRVEIASDTAGAARELAASDDGELAVICSARAARLHGLRILQRDVGDVDGNLTRFLLIARQPERPPQGVRCKTTIVVALDHARGSLAAFLSRLAEHGVNVTRIESRPQIRKPWEFQFLIDLEGDSAAEPLASALPALRPLCNALRELGSYPERLTTGLPRSQPAAAPAPAQPASAPQPEPARPTRALELAGVRLGHERFALIAGPCAVESEAQIEAAAELVAARGLRLMRAGAFKPRTSPRSFQGLGEQGLVWFAQAARSRGLATVTEILRTEDLELLLEHADVLQVGARNMQNYELLKELGHVDRPILLKRGMSSTLDELLGAVEYITAGGNQRVVICERGIRTFERATRFSLDLGATAALMQRTELPVIVDPSHAAGRRELVAPLALAAAAAGVHGLIVEVHPDRERALCDKDQALTPEDLDALLAQLRPILEAQGRTMR